MVLAILIPCNLSTKRSIKSNKCTWQVKQPSILNQEQIKAIPKMNQASFIKQHHKECQYSLIRNLISLKEPNLQAEQRMMISNVLFLNHFCKRNNLHKSNLVATQTKMQCFPKLYLKHLISKVKAIRNI